MVVVLGIEFTIDAVYGVYESREIAIEVLNEHFDSCELDKKVNEGDIRIVPIVLNRYVVL